MAQRRGGSAAPVKQKLRKRHGPKRHLHAGLKPLIWAYAQCGGLLNKYNNYESFCISCADRGVKNNLRELWNNYLAAKAKGGTKAQDEFLKTIHDRNADVMKRMSKKAKK